MVTFSLDSKEIAGFSGSVISVIVFVWGVIGPIIPAVVFTASLSYFFQRLNQKEVRKYEQRRVLVTEAMGPLHGDFRRLIDAFESMERDRRFEVLPECQEWSKIRSSYRYFLIEEELRTRLDSFFSEYDTFHQGTIGRASDRITHISINELRPSFAFASVTTPLPPQFETPDPPIIHMGEGQTQIPVQVWGYVFWRTDPRTNSSQPLHDVTLNIVTQTRRPIPAPMVGDEANRFLNEFLRRVGQESDRDSIISGARVQWTRLSSQAKNLHEEVMAQIDEWTK